MSEAEREEMKAGQAAARLRAQTRKETARELTKRILALRDDGQSDVEIGKALGLSARRVREFASKRGILVSRAEGVVMRKVTLERDREIFLRRLAADYRSTPAQTMSELISLALEADAAQARRILGVKRGACAQSVVAPAKRPNGVRLATIEDFLAMARADGTPLARRPQ